MKKTLFAIFLSLLLVVSLTACKSNGGSSLKKQTLICTKETKDSNGKKSSQKVVATYVNSKIDTVNSEIVTETDPKYIDVVISASSTIVDKLNSIDGLTVKYSKASKNEIKITMNMDYNKLDPKQIKETLGSLYSEEDSGLYNLKDVTISDLKKEMKKNGYSCK